MSFSLPNWVVSGILGLVIGAGGAYVGLLNYQAAQDKTSLAVPAVVAAAANKTMASGSEEAPSMASIAARKSNLTSLVGKLEMLSRPDLELRVELAPEQVPVVVALLNRLDEAQTMTAEEAQSYLVDLDSLLTEEQKRTLEFVVLPMARGKGPSPVMGDAGSAPNENPFSQETNRNRLRALLKRLDPTGNNPESKPANDKDGEKPAESGPSQLPLNPLKRPLQLIAREKSAFQGPRAEQA
jgi:hypothetical protein